MVSQNVFILLLLTFSNLQFLNATPEDDDVEWAAFKQRHGKNHEGAADARHKRIYFANKAKIIAHNNDESKTSKLEINKFADIDPEEFSQLINGLKESPPPSSSDTSGEVDANPSPNGNNPASSRNRRRRQITTIPTSFDWRTKGVLQPIRFQGYCGSCWAFATVSTIETQYKIKKNITVALSEQNLVDCNTSNSGCDGGYMAWAFDYIKSNGLGGGIDTQSYYPYRFVQGTCKYNSTYKGATVTGYKFVKNEFSSDLIIRNAGVEELKAAIVNVGPIAVTVDGSTSAFQLYKSGILSTTDCSNPYNPDHAVVVVGYGRDTAKAMDYWIVRNS